ncbi:hypothetical protein ARAF_2574 [Arsenophonus endosymbiont of Aleurodicus floccissimus]|uniref:DUF2165 family protein n=1 Tax=Arsenophonus endosymbiont of Aleurodicus floccissimus TaxID=2152761 RepID=UPI000E6B2171|nr:DUF2165 domain-containing protein [Arsenophonus endosymbiont of Aleurodicus floccissimus]SPP32410.1 hypothetical protein ARAF_2574 [Arsenophonus endosymbiont of Aleurodicus floccissimus]
MIIRLSKALAVCAVALLCLFSGIGNITDYDTNFALIRHVLLMDTIFPEATIKYCEIESPTAHNVSYIILIILQTLTAVLCWIGGIRLLANLKNTAANFNRKKKIAISGLTLGFLTWQVVYISLGREWFGMWMSEWNSGAEAFQVYTTILLVIIYLVHRDRDRNRERDEMK